MKQNSSTEKSKNRGFTLVELIVVIAILAILSAVGAVAYTGYIEHTKKGLDKQTVGEIMHALELANYDDPTLFGEKTVVVVGLTKNGIKAQGPSGLTSALENAFGDLASTKLSYDKWEGADLGVLPTITNKEYVKNYLDALKESDGTASTYTGHFDEVWDEMTKFLTMLHGNSGALPDGITGGADDYLDKIVTYSTGASAPAIKNAWEQGKGFDVSELQNNPTVFGARLARNMAFALYAQSRTDIYDPATMGEKLEQFKDNAAASEDVFGEFCFQDDPNATEWAKLLNEYKSSGKAAQDAKAYLGLMQAADEVGKNTGGGHLKDTEFLDKMSNYMGMMDGIFSGEIDVSEDTGLGSWSSEGSNIILIKAQKLPDGTLDCDVSPNPADPRGTEEKYSTDINYSGAAETLSFTDNHDNKFTANKPIVLSSTDSSHKSCVITAMNVSSPVDFSTATKVGNTNPSLVSFDQTTGTVSVVGTGTGSATITVTIPGLSPRTFTFTVNVY